MPKTSLENKQNTRKLKGEEAKIANALKNQCILD